MEQGVQVLDNEASVGRNCITYLQDNVCCKVYNKMVQTLKSFSVRGNGGWHLKDWVTQTGTQLAKGEMHRRRGKMD